MEGTTVLHYEILELIGPEARGGERRGGVGGVRPSGYIAVGDDMAYAVLSRESVPSIMIGRLHLPPERN